MKDEDSGKLSGFFDWGGFYGHVGQDSIAAVLWASDSRWFALSYAVARGYMGNAVYGRGAHGWVRVPLPDYMSRVKKLAHLQGDFYGKGCETPKAWLNGHTLRIEVADRNLVKADGSDEQRYWVTLDMQIDRKTQRPFATLSKIEPAPGPTHSR